MVGSPFTISKEDADMVMNAITTGGAYYQSINQAMGFRIKDYEIMIEYDCLFIVKFTIKEFELNWVPCWGYTLIIKGDDSEFMIDIKAEDE